MRDTFGYPRSPEVPVSKSRVPTQAPWEFLLSASRNTLQSYELSRLAHAANLKKEISALLEQWLQETTAANLARWLIEQRQRTVTVASDEEVHEPASASNGGVGSSAVASDNFLAEPLPSAHDFARGA